MQWIMQWQCFVSQVGIVLYVVEHYNKCYNALNVRIMLLQGG